MTPGRLTRAAAQKTLNALHAENILPAGFRFDIAGVEHLDTILDIAGETFKTDQPTRRGMRHFLTRAHALVILLIAPDKSIIGYVHIEANAGNNSVYVNTTVIRPHWRGRGLGKNMFALHDRLAKDAGFKFIRMHISEHTAANLHLAQKNGYEEIWFGPYLDEGSNSYLMRKTL